MLRQQFISAVAAAQVGTAFLTQDVPSSLSKSLGFGSSGQLLSGTISFTLSAHLYLPKYEKGCYAREGGMGDGNDHP